MGIHWRLLMVCAVLWTVAVGFMIEGTIEESWVLMGWACFMALVASIASGWMVAICAATIAAKRERLELERLAEIMATCAYQQAGATRIH